MYKKEDINEISKIILSKAHVEWKQYSDNKKVIDETNKVLNKVRN